MSVRLDETRAYTGSRKKNSTFRRTFRRADEVRDRQMGRPLQLLGELRQQRGLARSGDSPNDAHATLVV